MSIPNASISYFLNKHNIMYLISATPKCPTLTVTEQNPGGLGGRVTSMFVSLLFKTSVFLPHRLTERSPSSTTEHKQFNKSTWIVHTSIKAHNDM